MSGFSGLNQMRLTPHAVRPGLIQPLVEDIAWQLLLGEITNFGTIGDEAIYANQLTTYDSPSKVSGASTWSDDVSTPTASFSQIVAAYYKIKSRFYKDKITDAKFSKMGYGVSQEQLGFTLAKQGIYQRKALGTIYGYDPSKSQGIASNIGSSIPLPADVAGHTTVLTYAPNELMTFLNAQIREMLNFSYGRLKPVVIASSWRVINYLKTSIVPLTSYQLVGSGTASVAETMKNVLDPILNGLFKFVPMSYLQSTVDTDPDRMYIVSPGLASDEIDGDVAPMNDLPNNVMANTWYDEVYDIVTEVNPPKDGITSTNVYSILSIPIVTRPPAVREITLQYQ